MMNRNISPRLQTIDWERDRLVSKESIIVEFVLDRLSELEANSKWNRETMLEYVSAMLAPYRVSDENMRKLVEKGLKQVEISI